MSLTFAIHAYSDLDPVEDRRPLWGDYWFKHHLTEALLALGMEQRDERPDVLLHLFGTPMPDLPRARLRLLWIHSHPDRITPSLLRRYDFVFCASKAFTRRLACSGLPVEWLMTPTHMKPLSVDQEHPLLFVGNNRREGLRKVMALLLEEQDRLSAQPAVWGNGWDGNIPADWYRGRSVPNKDLNRLYASAAIVLNDHHEDMAREGFINPRIIDATVAGALVLTDPALGLGDLADLPVYRSGPELREQIRHYLESPDERRRIRNRVCDGFSAFIYPEAASIILRKVRALMDGRNLRP